MTMNVQGPGGIVVAFPDGTDDATIDEGMRQAIEGVDAPAVKSDRMQMAPGVTPHAIPPAPADRGTLDAVLGGLGQGMTFGIGDELAGGVTGITDALGFGPEGSQGTFSGGYNRFVNRNRAWDEAAAKNHPYAFYGSEVAGTIPTLAATGGINVIPEVAAAAKAAPLLTRAAAGLARGGARVGNAALTGGVYSAIQGAGSAEGGPGERVKGAAEAFFPGAAVGGLLPVAGAALRGTGSLLGHPIDSLKALWNPGKVAAGQLTDAAIRDAGSVSQATQALQNLQSGGAPATALDLGETARALARRSANYSPEARATLNDLVDPRFETQFNRVRDVITRVAPGVNAPATRAFLEQAAAAANKPAYAKAFLEGEKGIWNEGLQQLTAAPDMQTAIRMATRTGANKAAIEGFRPPQNPFVQAGDGSLVLKPGTRPTLQFWDAVKRNLDSKIGKAARAGDKPLTMDLTKIKQQLVAHLDEAAPSYKAARAGAADFFGAESASEAGGNFVHMPLGTDEMLAAEKALAKMSAAERALFGEGFATKLLSDLSNVGDRAGVTNRIFNSPAARRRLTIALGAPAAREMEGAMRVETIMDLGRKAVQGNSSTARQLIEAGVVGTGIGVYSSGANPVDPRTWLNPQTLITSLLSAAAVRGGRAGINHINVDVANQVAKMLTSSDPQIVRKAFKMIGNNPAMMEALRRGQDRLSRMISPVVAQGAGSGGGLPISGLAGIGGPPPANANQ